LTLSARTSERTKRIATDCRTRPRCQPWSQSGQGLYLVRLPDPIRGQSLLAFIYPASTCTACCGPFVLRRSGIARLPNSICADHGSGIAPFKPDYKHHASTSLQGMQARTDIQSWSGFRGDPG